MHASLRGREELTVRVQRSLRLATKKEAEMIVETVVAALEATLLNNLESDGFTLKLGSFAKLSVQHKAGFLRRIPLTGETVLTKDRRVVRFVSLGNLRKHEKVVDLATLAAILGHSSLRVVQKYVHPTADHKRRAMQTYEQSLAEMVEASKEESEKRPQ
jgi:nucleoid DNA-binding protein